MSFLTKVKPHKPVVGLEGYFVTLLAKSKFGKTTFLYDLMREYYNGDLSKAILLAPEVGFKTLDGIYALPISEFDSTTDEEKEEQNVFGFTETVDDLIESRDEHGFKAVIIDTITALERLAIKHVVKKEAIKAKKRYTGIGDIPFGGGYNLVAEEIYNQIDRLKKAGFFVAIIGHEKTKQVEQKNGDTYNLITLNALGKTVDIIEREADMIIYGDLITTVNDGVATQERVLRFRSDGNIVCGSRFRTMPDQIPLDSKLFLETFKDAVVESFNGDEDAVEEAKKEQDEEKEKKVESFVNKEKSKVSAEDTISQINDLVKDMDKTQQAELKKQLKEEFGAFNYKKYEDDKLPRALEIAKSL